MKLQLLSVAVAGVLVPAAALAEPRSHPCIGHWVGTGQNSVGLPWSIDLHVTNTDPGCGRIAYRSSELRCGGPLVGCRFEEASVRYRERYTYNENCATDGWTGARCEGDVMHWAFYGWETTRSRLRRVGEVPTPPNSPQEPEPPADPTEPSEPAEPEPETEPGPPAEPDPPVDPEPTAESDGGGCDCSATAPHHELGPLLLLSVVALGWRLRRSEDRR